MNILVENYKHFTNYKFVGVIKKTRKTDENGKPIFSVGNDEYKSSSFVKVGTLDLGYGIDTFWSLK